MVNGRMEDMTYKNNIKQKRLKPNITKMGKHFYHLSTFALFFPLSLSPPSPSSLPYTQKNCYCEKVDYFEIFGFLPAFYSPFFRDTDQYCMLFFAKQ